jgi:hypothetical protein
MADPGGWPKIAAGISDRQVLALEQSRRAPSPITSPTTWRTSASTSR